MSELFRLFQGEKIQGINGAADIPYLKVKVRTGAVAGAAHMTNYLSLQNILISHYSVVGQMAVIVFPPAVICNNDIGAVSAGVTAAPDHPAGSRRINVCAAGCGKINAFMELFLPVLGAPAIPIADGVTAFW